MSVLTGIDRKRIESAIAEAEQGTSGEIVCVVARAASDYRYIAICWAAVVALALPWPLLRWTEWSAERIHLLQLAAFLGVAVLIWLLPNRHVLVPRMIRSLRARREAEQQFLAQRIFHTTGRTGCLIYVAEAERFAAVLTDRAIAEKVPEDLWKQAIDAMTDGLKSGQPSRGIVEAIGCCGRILADHAPPAAQNRNELPNRVILL